MKMGMPSRGAKSAQSPRGSEDHGKLQDLLFAAWLGSSAENDKASLGCAARKIVENGRVFPGCAARTSARLLPSRPAIEGLLITAE
jgi:hypothetical protein